jgi:hypothetical protein
MVNLSEGVVGRAPPFQLSSSTTCLLHHSSSDNQSIHSSHIQSKMSLKETITLPTGKKYEQPTGLFIGGEFVKSVDGKTFETINPSTEKPICSVQEASEKDVDIAVLVASSAHTTSDHY